MKRDILALMEPAGETDDQPSLSLAITAFDEAVRLPRSLEHVLPYLEAQGQPYEVVINDDGSSDATPSCTGT